MEIVSKAKVDIVRLVKASMVSITFCIYEVGWLADNKWDMTNHMIGKAEECWFEPIGLWSWLWSTYWVMSKDDDTA